MNTLLKFENISELAELILVSSSGYSYILLQAHVIFLSLRNFIQEFLVHDFSLLNTTGKKVHFILEVFCLLAS